MYFLSHVNHGTVFETPTKSGDHFGPYFSMTLRLILLLSIQRLGVLNPKLNVKLHCLVRFLFSGMDDRDKCKSKSLVSALIYRGRLNHLSLTDSFITQC